MEYSFLEEFPKRMKNVGLYTTLVANSLQKTTWKQYGFISIDEQMNLLFSVLLYIMEQSLKEDPCTIDEIAVFIDDVNIRYFRKPMTFQDCRKLGDFIVNIVLSNEGKSMFFHGFDFQKETYKKIHISYVANKIIYVDNDIRRTSYYLTENGYNLLLGTLEIESNMKLTIQEMIFKMHLEKQSYDKALNDIKNIFNLMRIQVQKNQDAVLRIRRNVLEYSASEYAALLQENLSTIDQTKQKFNGYKNLVLMRVEELEESHIQTSSFDEETEEKIKNLKEIGSYLGSVIEEHQKILNSHFDLKSLYANELEKLSEMSLVQRFSLRKDVYEPILENPDLLEKIEAFLSPLFSKEPDRIFNLNKILEAQQITHAEEESDSVETDTFDEEEWEKEQELLQQEEQEKYKKCLTAILQPAVCTGSVALSQIALNKEELVPTILIFKEVIMALLKINTISIEELREAEKHFIQDNTDYFRLDTTLLKIIEEHPDWPEIGSITISRREKADPVVIKDVPDKNGAKKTIRCTDVMIKIQKK